MPQINVTIDDVNPLIFYEPAGAWREKGPEADLLSPHFFDETRMQTPFQGASASVSFYGSAVWLFGAKRADYGNYNVTLDGQTSSFNGTGNDTYQTPIFIATGLALGNHSLTLTNAQINKSARWVALDYIVWQTEIGQEGDTIIPAVIDDEDSAFVYHPHDAWTTDPQNISKSSNGTAHQTVTNGAYVTFKFSGDSVELFGSVGPAMSEYSVQLDNGKPIVYNATRLNNYNEVPLFFATNLSAGAHTLKVVNVPPSTGLGLSIDYANITGTTNSPPYALYHVPRSPHKHGTSAGTIVAIAVPTAVALLLIICLCLFLHRQRRKRGINNFEPIPFSPQTAQSRGGSLSIRFAGAFQSMVKSSIPPAIPPLSSQLRYDTVQAQAQTPHDRNRDEGVSLVSHELPPPDYRETTHILAS